MSETLIGFLLSISIFDIPEKDKYLIQACSEQCCISIKVERSALERDLVLDRLAGQIKRELDEKNSCGL